MARAIALRTDYTAEAFRRLASRARDANVARRFLSLAAGRAGMTADRATTALQRAIALRHPPPGRVHHADR